MIFLEPLPNSNDLIMCLSPEEKKEGNHNAPTVTCAEFEFVDFYLRHGKTLETLKKLYRYAGANRLLRSPIPL